ncbi:MAG: hypothetical protein WEC79_05545 [Thermomicrobiales bacterium]
MAREVETGARGAVLAVINDGVHDVGALDVPPVLTLWRKMVNRGN